MAGLMMGAMSNLIPKLYQLLEKEYNLQTGVKESIRLLTKELEATQAVLRKVAEVPWDQLDEQVKLWSRDVREASYDMEDVLDTFLVHVQQGPQDSHEKEESLLKQPLKSIANLWEKSKARRKVNGDMKDIMAHLQEMMERFHRYKVDDIVARPAATASAIDPRLHAMYNTVKDLVGIEKSSGELISMLQSPQRDEASDMKVKIVSVVGVGGLGKTTLSKAIYDKLRGDYDCGAFVPIGRNPDLKKIFKDILIDLDEERYRQFSTLLLDERQLINKIHSFLENKRYFVVIDDIWEIQSWKTIKLAINNGNNCGGRIIITTRKLEVATKADEIYKLQPLPYDSSRDLFYSRISGRHERGCVDNQRDDSTNKILHKCDGIPLAIITMASLLAGKQRLAWPRLYESIGFWFKDNNEAENTMKILSFSYYDLPSHLKTCLLYLSAFPEDSFIPKESLVWMWAAEGFVREKEGIRLFETGEEYFNDLINRSLIQPVESSKDHDIIIGCRVHDMVLDFLRTMSSEEKFFMVLDSDRATMIQNSACRLAHHNRTTELSHLANQSDMKKLRSFIAFHGVIETQARFSSFTLLRVLAIENYQQRDGTHVQVEHIGQLLHLRFLSLRGTRIKSILEEEIGALRFLQTLNLWQCFIPEFPLCSSFSKRLACLHISLDGDALDGRVFSLEGLTTLEELAIQLRQPRYSTISWPVKGLGCLGELRVLVLDISRDTFNEENRRDLLESICRLDKLQKLKIDIRAVQFRPGCPGTELVLPHQIQHLYVSGIRFCRLSSCINPSCLPNLSHLDLSPRGMDEHDLKMLGGLPELRFLRLDLQWRTSSATISNISDCDACYFPKLRCFRLPWSMVLFVVNNIDDGKSVSFHIWSRADDLAMPPVSDNELKSDDKLQQSTPVSDEELDRPLQRQDGLAALLSYYLLFFSLHVIEFIKKWSLYQVVQHPSISNHSSTPTEPSISDNGEEDYIFSNGAATPPRFMPSLEVLEFHVHEKAFKHYPNCCNNLGWHHLSSLREIIVPLGFCENGNTKEKMKEALRHTARVHPNRPTLRFY